LLWRQRRFHSSRSFFISYLLRAWLIVSRGYEKAIEPMVARLIMSRSSDEVVANFEELKAILTSMLESDDMDTKDNIIIAFYALLEMAKVQAVNILKMRSQIAGLEDQIKK
jgi:hypothetical protein